MIKRRVFLTIFAVVALSASVPSFSMDIFEAIEIGDLNLVRELVEKVDVNEIKNEDGLTPLNLACDTNNTEIAKLLLSKCTDETVNNYSFSGHSPLLCACFFECDLLVKLLLPKCTDETINKNGFIEGFTPLYLACNRNNLEILKLLLENGAKVDTEGIALLGLTQEIRKYCDLALDYDATPNKMQFILNKAQDKDEFNFLVKLAFGRSLRELEVNKLKSPYETIFFELFANKDINLQKIFDVPTNGGLHDFMEQAAKKNCFRTYESPTGKPERLGLNPMGGQTFFSNLSKQISDNGEDKKRYKKLKDCCVIMTN